MRKIRIAWIALLGIAAAAHANPPPFSTAPERYRLTYRVRPVGPAASKKAPTGQFDVAETNGRLLLRMSVPGERTQTLLYDGKDTYTFSGDRSGLISAGLQPFSFLSVYLPFNYHCLQTYHSVQGKPHKLGVAISAGAGVLYIGGQLFERSSRSKRELELTVGVPEAPMHSYAYSDLRPVLGIEGVPSRFTATSYRQHLNAQKRVVSTPVTVYALDLVSSGQTYAPNPELDFHGFLRKGMLVSGGRELAYAGVEYDPAEGSFESQLARQVALRKKHAARQEESHETREPWGPKALAGAFGAGVVLCVLRSRSQKPQG